MGGRKQILVVDDSKLDRVILNQILKKTYDVIEAESGRAALEILESAKETIVAVILDVVMPEMDGFEYLRIHMADERLKWIPVIVTTSYDNEWAEQAALEAGAWEFIAKPYHPEKAFMRIHNVIMHSIANQEEWFHHQEEFDELTEIYNKQKFFQATRVLLDENPEQKFVYIRMDIEKFQLVNNFFGMIEGDRLLRSIAREIVKAAGGNPLVTYGRIEADIFALCIPYRGDEALIELVNEARERFHDYHLEFDIVPNFGFYIIEEPKLTINDMDDRANLAAKRSKGNYIKSYEIYTDDMSENLVKEQRIVNRMRKALQDEEFVVFLQPKVYLQQKSICGAEALVRWKTKESGMISPGEFIPIFERNGFIMELDYYVWEKTCQLLAKWIQEGKSPCPISVNISRVSTYNFRMVENICALVEKYNVPPELLQLELTESAFTNNPVVVKDMMKQLQKAGFTILMDDFGSGYSSLNILKDIEVDVLKIDMKFLADSDRPARGENILASVVRMAKWLNLPVVAEGVERKEQVLFLQNIGCEYVQGFYFAKPMPIEEYENVVYEIDFEKDTAFFQAETKEDLWDETSQMELMFTNMLQPTAVYEYENGWIEIIRVNKAYYDLFGYHNLDEKSQGQELIVGEESRKIVLDAFQKTVDTKEVMGCEFKRRTSFGKEIWVQIKLKYIKQIGTRYVIVGALVDISEQKALDAELQKYREALSEEHTGKETILIVDDLDLNRVSLRCIFEEKYNVLEAENGQVALGLLESEKVDIILLDLMMPVMDGTTFLKIFKDKIEVKEIPVVIITSDDTTKRQIQTLKLGAEDYIVKPFVPEIAIRRVEHVLDARKRKRRSGNEDR